MKKYLLISAILLIGVIAFAGTGSALPEWYGQIGSDDFIYGFGQAEGQNFRATSSRATAFAMAEASISVETHLQKIIDAIVGEVNIMDLEVVEQIETVARIVVSQRFSWAKVLNSEVIDLADGNFKAYIHFAIPKMEVNSHFVNEISYEETLHDLIKDSFTFKQLESEN